VPVPANGDVSDPVPVEVADRHHVRIGVGDRLAFVAKVSLPVVHKRDHDGVSGV